MPPPFDRQDLERITLLQDGYNLVWYSHATSMSNKWCVKEQKSLCRLANVKQASKYLGQVRSLEVVEVQS